MLTSTEEITEKEILDTFKDAGVLEAFKKLSENEKKEMTEKITSLTSEDKQVKMMLKYIDQLSKKNDLKKTKSHHSLLNICAIKAKLPTQHESR